MASLEGDLAAALALAVLDVGANVIDSDERGMVVARGPDRVRLVVEVRPEPERERVRR